MGKELELKTYLLRYLMQALHSLGQACSICTYLTGERLCGSYLRRYVHT